jgi:ABC-type nitrate/sulfonate/bicarbonate transport system permease component
MPIPRRFIRGLGSRLLAVAVLVSVWWTVVAASGSDMLPTPAGVAASLGEQFASGTLVPSTLTTASRILTGFAIGFSLALVVGTMIGTSRTAAAWLDPWLNTFRPIAPFAWIPMAILWFGIGSPAAIFIVSYAAFFPVVISVIQGVRGVDGSLVRAARSLGASRLRVLRHVVIPDALPAVLVGARLGMGTAWTSVIAAELTVASRAGSVPGLGEQMVITISFRPDLDWILALIVVVGFVALLIDSGLRWVYDRLIVWPA